MADGPVIDDSGHGPASQRVGTPSAVDGERPHRIFTGRKITAAGGLIRALQSMVWVQGYGNLAVELRQRSGWSKTFFSLVFAATRTERKRARALSLQTMGFAIGGFASPLIGDDRLGFTILAIGAARGTIFWIEATPPSIESG